VFRGEVYGVEGRPIPNARVVWNFGDGAAGEGTSLSHSYHIPGRYVVVVSASSGGLSGFSRTTVEAVDPAISIVEVRGGSDGFVRLENGSAVEINLTGWIIESGGAKFMLPPETIILPRSRLAFSAATAGFSMNPSDTALLYPNGVYASRFEPAPSPENKPPAPISNAAEPKRAPIRTEAPAVSPSVPLGERRVPSSSPELAAVASAPTGGGPNVFLWLLGTLALVGGGIVAARLSKASPKREEPRKLRAEDFTIVEE
jgi:hypothetical protein